MATNSWTYDAPSGVAKNHDLSSKLRFAAIKEVKFAQFANTNEDGFGKAKGESVTVVRVSNVAVPTDDKLVELDLIPEDTLSLSSQAITVYERGRAIPYTSLAKDLASYNLENAIQMKLKDQLSLRLDKVSSDAFKTGQLKYVPTGVAAATLYTNGAAGTSALANMNTYHIETIRDYMYSTYNIKPYEGDDYMCIVSTKGKRGIVSDPQWQDWKKYTDPEAKYNGEIGKWENIRFIESNNTDALSGSLGTGSVLGEAVFFGADPVVMASAQDPELRTEVPKDFGRKKAVAWYGIYGYAQIWYDSANAGEARVIHVTST